ncbi:hypothetical protein FSC37_01005 [Piscinibacter aquaticus]|uniref:Uncharacterized protein n=1 Tax=Piscinibacter aquaticus TaxID=392597 RepID=A0A5C6TXJ3_9BURK|nr:hypothetical protein FSC37_01005 [Piscinibacter aquaticus]
MSTHFLRTTGLLASVLLASSAHSALAAASAEQVVGGIEAVLFVCTPLDAKSVKPGQELLQRAVEQRKLDLAAIRKTEAYRVAYNAEANRLLALPQRERVTACQTAW